MRVLLLGATGMVGTAVLRRLVADASVREVLAVGRRNARPDGFLPESSDINRLGRA